jgi:dTDP-4-dehydrorhamnose reductase
MRALIVGASGLVGSNLLVQLRNQANVVVVGTYHQHPVAGLESFDILDRVAVHRFFERVQPTVVFLSAALSNVDFCELHPDLSYEANVSGVKQIVKAAKRCQAKLVFFSTDYIFDGRAGPYSEEDAASPISQYGWHKALAEHHIALHAADYLIIRTTGVYGWESQGKNFIYRLLKTLPQGQAVRVPIDQVANPTYAPNLAAATVELVKAGANGVFNLVGCERISRYEFAREAARVFGLNPELVQPVLTAELGQPAARPLEAGLKVDKAQAILHMRLLDYSFGLSTMRADAAAEQLMEKHT